MDCNISTASALSEETFEEKGTGPRDEILADTYTSPYSESIEYQHMYPIIRAHTLLAKLRSKLAHAVSTPSLVQLESRRASIESHSNSGTTEKYQHNGNIFPEEQLNACSSQRDFIPLNEIKRLPEGNKGGESNATTDDEFEKQTASHGRRHESSNENEDVSQSICDAIKRCLCIARKSVHNDHTTSSELLHLNQYSREVNPAVTKIAQIQPRKASQKSESEDKINQSTSSCSPNQLPTVANITSEDIFEENSDRIDGTYNAGPLIIPLLSIANTAPSTSSPLTFLKPPTTTSTKEPNLQKQEQLNLASSTDATTNPMKTSKSLSHTSNNVSPEQLTAHTEDQPEMSQLLAEQPSSTSAVPKWSRAGKCVWRSEDGDFILLRNTVLNVLSELEREMVKEVCIGRIMELDIGIDITDLTGEKPHNKDRRPIMKALTTRFFNNKKKDSTSQHFSLFGSSLEECVAREMAYISNFEDSESAISTVSFLQPDCSGGNAQKSCNKLHGNECLCANFVSKSDTHLDKANTSNNTDRMLMESRFDNMPKIMNLESRSLSDGSNLGYRNLIPGHRPDVQIFKELKAPKFVKYCIHLLENYGLHEIGLFRVSVSRKKIKKLRETFEKDFYFTIDENTCPHSVATLLKDYLRELPEPLIPNRLYDAFLKTQRIRNLRLKLDALSDLVKLLPPVHFDTLYVLLNFLAKVDIWSDDICYYSIDISYIGNRMDSNNLATIFAPNILRSTANCKSQPGDLMLASAENQAIEDAINITRVMIDHNKELFVVPAEVLDVALLKILDRAPEKLNAICKHHKAAEYSFVQFY